MKQKVIAICGIKNSGKTTLIEKLVQVLASRGYQVAVIKHDGHDFTCDVPGTDSFRFAEAGAYGTAVFSGHRMFVHRTGTGETEQDLIRMFPEADIILIEGLKDSTCPKIEVIRKEISKEPVSNSSGRFLIVSDLPGEDFQERTLSFDDTDRIIEAILDRNEGYAGGKDGIYTF